eukprot:7368133-Ditylum_brightwellii.AAC.1
MMKDEDVVLMIGAFESAFSADVVASYIFKMMEVSGTYLQFTTELWAPTVFQQEFDEEHKDKDKDTPGKKQLKQVKVVTENAFQFLDMGMSWTREGGLQFSVFNKKKQAIKYVDKGSTHCP